MRFNLQSISTTHSKFFTYAIAALPGLLAILFITPTDFASPGSVLNTLGRLTGIWGMALILVAAMLCCRVPGFDQPFGGLTKLWKLHHILGAIGFIMLLMHPLFLAFGAAEVSLHMAVATLFSTQIDVLWGWTALIALMIFMAPTFSFFGKPNYQRWKWLHKFSGITVVFALLHTLALSRTLPELYNVVIWGLFTLAALLAISYRLIFCHWIGRLSYRVSKVIHQANNVIELSLQANHSHLQYQPGQFVYLTVHGSDIGLGKDEEHPYTLSSAPEEPELRIAIKALGDSSRAIQNIKLNTEVSVEGPYGRFFSPSQQIKQPELWIAGGIGITPFLGRLRHHARLQENPDIHLIYCVQDAPRLIFANELERLKTAMPNFCFTPHFFFQQGPLTLDFITQDCADFANRQAYICGPLPLINASRQILTTAGVASSQITTEEFVLL